VCSSLSCLLSQISDTAGPRGRRLDRCDTCHTPLERLLCSAWSVLSRGNGCNEGIVSLEHPLSQGEGLLDEFQAKHEVKARLTLSSSGISGGEGARTHIQVLTNSVAATVLILLHRHHLQNGRRSSGSDHSCWAYSSDLLVIGIIR